MPNLSDKISKYLIPLNQEIPFIELSADFLKRANLKDLLQGVPVPIVSDAEGENSASSMVTGMARVIGADADFPYVDTYIAALRRLFGDNAVKVLLSEGAKNGELGHYEVACMIFRAALKVAPDNRDALYLYGRACKDAYEQEELEEDYVGNFKAQSIDIFEELTIEYPEYAMGYYFLGYSYVNMGLNIKAQLTWDEFMRLTRDYVGDDDAYTMNPMPADEIEALREEIGTRLESLEDPVVIEQGVNHIMSGDYQGGLEVLSEYKQGQYANWWPLWYYIGMAETGLGHAEAAIEAYRQVLRMSPSNIQVMMELIELYQAIGDHVNAEKYINKVQLIQSGFDDEVEDLN